jgi:hypothetical protein
VSRWVCGCVFGFVRVCVQVSVWVCVVVFVCVCEWVRVWVCVLLSG